MERVQAILVDKDFQEHLRLVEVAEKNRVYCHHDYHHVLSVARLAYLIVLEERIELPSPIKPIIYAAGLLHDIGRWLEYSTGEDHAIASARLAEPILKRAGFHSAEIDLIVTGIAEHRVTGKSLLGQVLARADDLSRDCRGCQSRETCYKAEEMLRLHGRIDL